MAVRLEVAKDDGRINAGHTVQRDGVNGRLVKTDGFVRGNREAVPIQNRLVRGLVNGK